MFRNVFQIFRGYEPLEIILEMAVIWVCVYIIFRFLRGTRGAGVIKGFAVLLVLLTLVIRVVGQGSDAFGRLNFIYDRFLGLLAILLIVVFQPELRQAMIRLGHARLFRATATKTDRLVGEVVDAATFLSKSRFGALIAIERTVGLGGLTEGGVTLDASVDSRLIQSIFWPNSPLHDLGIVIRGDRIVAASVQFPLVEDGALPASLGSRHRAGVGLTMDSDCIVIIVSEETGSIRLAEHGELSEPLDPEHMGAELRSRLLTGPTTSTEEGSREPSAEESLPKTDLAATRGGT